MKRTEFLQRVGRGVHRATSRSSVNMGKTVNNVRREEENPLVEERRGDGIATGEYQGRGKSGATDEDDQASSKTDLLHFYTDTETTGLNVYGDKIIEIAAKVIGATGSQGTFQSLVRTSKTIPEKVEKLTGIYNDDLLGEDPLSEVLPKFFDWVRTTTREHSRNTGKDFHPVLVAHNGFNFDFPILLAEIDRQKENFSSSILCQLNVHFADTLPLLRKAKKDGCEALQEVTKFSMTKLLEKLVPYENFSDAHRALPDVKAMEALFTVESLRELLPSLAVRTPQQQIELWTLQKQTRSEVQRLLPFFGNKITKEHAKQLINLDITFDTLEKWKGESKDKQDFVDILKRKGVNIKILQRIASWEKVLN